MLRPYMLRPYKTRAPDFAASVTMLVVSKAA